MPLFPSMPPWLQANIDSGQTGAAEGPVNYDPGGPPLYRCSRCGCPRGKHGANSHGSMACDECECNGYEPAARDQGRTRPAEAASAAIFETAEGQGHGKARKRPKINPPVERLCSLFSRYFGEGEREYRFHPDRRWRFDIAFPDAMLAVEYEGVFAEKSRHTTIDGFDGDCEKYSTAALLGWTVVRVTAIMLRDGRAESLAELAASTQKGG